MAAPKGNRFWEARSSHGRKPIFESPEQLEAACDEYFDWVANNPLVEIKPFAYEGSVTFEDVPKMRAMTIDGLTDFLDIDPQTWANYRAKEDFFGVVSRAERIIRRQKFEGASAGFLNANIIARDLGLAERNEHSGPNGSPMQTDNVWRVEFVNPTPPKEED